MPLRFQKKSKNVMEWKLFTIAKAVTPISPTICIKAILKQTVEMATVISAVKLGKPINIICLTRGHPTSNWPNLIRAPF